MRTWLDEDVWQSSVAGYGYSSLGEVRNLDRDVGREANVADVVVFMALYMTKRITLLEIAPSAGKLLFQAISSFEDALLFAVDMENINPTLSRLLTETSPAVDLAAAVYPLGYVTPRSAPAHSAEYLYAPDHNIVRYIASDPLNKMAWAALEGAQFNVIVSRTRRRTAETMRHEYAMLKQFRLLDEAEFLLVFEDLEESETMDAVFADLVSDIKAAVSVYSVITRIRGESGKNDAYRRVGIVTTLDLTGFEHRQVF